MFGQVFPFSATLTTLVLATLVCSLPRRPATQTFPASSHGKPTTSEANGRELCALPPWLVRVVSVVSLAALSSAHKTNPNIILASLPA